MRSTIQFAFVVLAAAASFVCHAGETGSFGNVACEGDYQHHLQGVCTNDVDAIYWSFTTELVKTDLKGHVTTKIPVVNHHGDLCFHDNKVYVAVNLGKFSGIAEAAL